MVISVAQADAMFDETDKQEYEAMVTAIDKAIGADYEPHIGSLTIRLPKHPNGRVVPKIQAAYQAAGWKQVTFTQGSCYLSKWEQTSFSQYDR